MSALQCPPVRRAGTQVGPYTGPNNLKSKIGTQADKVIR
jgi:hypothetical protein